ncbi:MAG: tyrosine transporter [Chlamydiia bacterium]|nr:tyrosine transporter [Chlamydiia bacterium]
MDQSGSLLGGTLLVAGTAIGGGMLALPVLTADGGFFPSVFLYLLCWLFMASTGVLFVEIYLWNQKEVNIVSMAGYTLGKWGKAVAWIVYLYLFYSLSVAYVAGGGNVINDIFEILIPWVSQWVGPWVFVLMFAPFVYVGAKAVDRINTLFMMGLIISFVIFVILGICNIDARLLQRSNLPMALLATPVLFTSFGFQGVVPTVTTYLNRNPKRARLAIFIGSAIPFFVYLLWQTLILGLVPLDQLEKARMLGQSAVYPLRYILDLPWLFRVGEFFAFFAVVTSFLGVTIGLLDFLSDGFKIEKTPLSRFFLCLLIYLPPLVMATSRPMIFLDALNYAGGFGCALLLGLLPILMAWRGRYKKKFKNEQLLPGGRILLLLLLLFIVFELIVMVIKLIE